MFPTAGIDFDSSTTCTKVPTIAYSMGRKSQSWFSRYFTSAEPIWFDDHWQTIGDKASQLFDERLRFSAPAMPTPPEKEFETDEEGPQNYPSGLKLTIIMLDPELAVLCVALDSTIVAPATPKIPNLLHALDDVGWYGSAYLLTLCAFQLFFGLRYSSCSLHYESRNDTREFFRQPK